MMMTYKINNKMKKLNNFILLGTTCLLLSVAGCKSTKLAQKEENINVPVSYNSSTDSINSGQLNWKTYFKDTYLQQLITEGLANNQELNITLQEIEISRFEIRAKKGEYLPFLGIKGGAGVEKVGRYTSQGANDANTDIRPGVEFPEPLQDYALSATATWEIDIWKKLRNSKKAAVSKYLASIEGKNFMVTNLIAEVANSYYELVAFDNQLEILTNNIEIQENALRIVKLQKESAVVNELAVKRFEALVYDTKSMQFEIEQKIVEAENRINFLIGRFPQKIERIKTSFIAITPEIIQYGIPSQLLQNRPDIKQAELDLAAAKLDVKVARAQFYPSIGISAGVGFRAFDAKYLFTTPQSLMYSFAGELVAPLINRNAIKATYYSANAKQIQAVYNYEKTILNAYVEVANQLSNIENTKKTFDFKTKQVEALNQSITISNDLFRSARANYMEVLLTQKEALESEFDLIEIKKQQLNAMVLIYKSLGGGWK